MISIVVSVVLFFLSLLIFFSVRSSDRKSRSLQNVNMQLKNFRSEASRTMQDMHTTTQDCVDSVQSYITQARQTTENVIGSLERLKNHANDLTNLEGVCVNYRLALEKLKSETEHVEARITSVQKEVRKLEDIYAASKTFQGEADALINQIQDYKAEFVRLVASTQESLKQQAALQKNENSEMLSSFQGILDRQKVQFVEFMNNEKQGFVRECDEQLKIAESAGDKVRESKVEIDESLRNASQVYSSMKENFRAFMDDANKEAGAERENIRLSIEEARGKLDEELAAVKERMDEFQKGMETSFGSLSSELQRKKDDQEQMIKEKEASLSKLVADKGEEVSGFISDAERKVEAMSRTIEKERDSYFENTRLSYRAALAEELSESRGVLETLRNLVNEQIETLESRTGDIRTATEELSKESVDKLQDSIARLQELEEKITQSEANLTSIQEQVTSSKEQLYSLQMDHEKIQKLLEGARNELKSTEESVRKAKGSHLEMEADLARMKLEMDRKAEEEKKAAEKKRTAERSRAESLIQTFPEDIFIGDEEEIDLSDEDETDGKDEG